MLATMLSQTNVRQHWHKRNTKWKEVLEKFVFTGNFCNSHCKFSFSNISIRNVVLKYFYLMDSNDNTIAGDVTAEILSERIYQHGYQNIPFHTRSRITYTSVSIYTNLWYIYFAYFTLTSRYSNHKYMWIALNRVLTASDDEFWGLGIYERNGSEILGPIDSNQMVYNLSASQN